MELPFNIEIGSTGLNSFEELQQLSDLKEEIQNKMAEQFAQDLKTIVSQKLHSTKDQYIEAIKVEGSVVVLDKKQFIISMVEDGVPQFDMKPKMLASSKAKTAKNGQKYLVVPLSTVKNGKHNWRDQSSGQFKAGTSGVKGIEFRIVSEKSSANSWIFPGYKGNHFVDQTLDAFDNAPYEQMIENQLNKMFQ